MRGLSCKIFNKSFKHKLISILIVLLTIFYCNNLSYINVNAVESIAYETQNNEEVLSEVRAVLKNYYIDPVSEEVLGSKSIIEMISKLNDPYSTYFTKEEYDEFVNGIENKFVGIGINIEVVKEGIKVTNVMKGSPAEESGIKTNDIILKANNTSLAGMPSEEAVKYIKGEEGTQVTLLIKRGTNTLELTAIRRTISMPTVEWELVNNIGYISISSFGEKTGSEFAEALKNLNSKEVKAYVVDLRYNPGGYIYSALDIGGYIIGDKPMTLTEDRDKNPYTYKGIYHGTTIDKPLIFLINKYSASASELLSAAVKDYNKAFFIGTTTYGKGVAQSMFGLSDGGMLKLTTLKFYSPLGNTINHVGISPNLLNNDESVNSSDIAYLLLSGLNKNQPSNNDYIKLNMNNNIFYIDLKEARKSEYWAAYKYIINTASKDNIFIGYVDKWISYNELSSKNEKEFLYPNSKFLSKISKEKGNKNYSITFNKTVDIKSIDKDDIELINSVTGERIPYKITNTSNSSKINLSLEKEAEAGLYYLAINNTIKDENSRILAKSTVIEVTIK